MKAKAVPKHTHRKTLPRLMGLKESPYPDRHTTNQSQEWRGKGKTSRAVGNPVSIAHTMQVTRSNVTQARG